MLPSRDLVNRPAHNSAPSARRRQASGAASCQLPREGEHEEHPDPELRFAGRTALLPSRRDVRRRLDVARALPVCGDSEHSLTGTIGRSRSAFSQWLTRSLLFMSSIFGHPCGHGRSSAIHDPPHRSALEPPPQEDAPASNAKAAQAASDHIVRRRHNGTSDQVQSPGERFPLLARRLRAS